MSVVSWAPFDTSIGRCLAAWRDHGLVAVQLPEASERAALGRLRRRHPAAVAARPPMEVAAAMAQMQQLLAGVDVELSDVELDLDDVPDFDRRVYEVTRSIPRGSTLTYGDVARRVGEPGAAQAVGQALGRNPLPIVVPCHRVLGAGGALVGFSASGGVDTKLRMLAIEGAADEPLRLFDVAGAGVGV